MFGEAIPHAFSFMLKNCEQGGTNLAWNKLNYLSQFWDLRMYYGKEYSLQLILFNLEITCCQSFERTSEDMKMGKDWKDKLLEPPSSTGKPGKVKRIICSLIQLLHPHFFSSLSLGFVCMVELSLHETALLFLSSPFLPPSLSSFVCAVDLSLH